MCGCPQLGYVDAAPEESLVVCEDTLWSCTVVLSASIWIMLMAQESMIYKMCAVNVTPWRFYMFLVIWLSCHPSIITWQQLLFSGWLNFPRKCCTSDVDFVWTCHVNWTPIACPLCYIFQETSTRIIAPDLLCTGVNLTSRGSLPFDCLYCF